MSGKDCFKKLPEAPPFLQKGGSHEVLSFFINPLFQAAFPPA
ncbi:hypothetical protein [Komagataeibacter kakiaceti]|nr:hypothetical protein [Komagataeibacter kakiaceti]